MNIEQDIIDLYILYNGEKIKSKDSESVNYHRIICKDIGISENFQELSFQIINNIELNIEIRFSNKYRTRGKRFKNKIQFFNQKIEGSKETNQNKSNKMEINNMTKKEDKKEIKIKEIERKEKEELEKKQKEEIERKEKEEIEKKQKEELERKEKKN